VGAGGIAFTVVLFGGVFYFGFVQRGGIYDDMRRHMAQRQLNQLVQSIEFYKVMHGGYPATFEELQQAVGKETWTFFDDPSDMNLVGRRKFHYERVGIDKYYLRSVGPDGQPFTPDDILPQVDDAQLPKLGLLIAPPARR